MDVLPPNYEFEDRIVVFIDILGFSAIVERMSRDSGLLGRIIKTLETLHGEVEFGCESDEFSTAVVKHSFFSDSIVLSCTNEPKAYAIFLGLLAQLSWQMMLEGVLLRGGMALGRLYHNHHVVIGPAMISAYQLESRVAIFPRIVVETNLAARLNSYSFPDRFRTLPRKFLRRDFDGNWFIDYLPPLWDGADRPEEGALHIGREIADFLANAPKDQYAASKLHWLKSYFSRVSDEYGVSESFKFDA